MFPIKPNEDRIIIEPETMPDKTKGGLWIPDTAKGTPRQGKVIAVGPGVACHHCGLPKTIDVEVGATVMYPESAGFSFQHDDKDYLVIRATDIQLYLPNS